MDEDTQATPAVDEGSEETTAPAMPVEGEEAPTEEVAAPAEEGGMEEGEGEEAAA